jgi:hypothetical protein
MEQKPKRLTVQQLIKEEKAIWVRNTKPGIVLIKIGDPKTNEGIMIPAGPDPICLTDQADTSALKTSRDLFRLIDSGALILLDPDRAEEYYMQNDERKQVMQEKISKYIFKSKETDVDPKPVGISSAIQRNAKNIQRGPDGLLESEKPKRIRTKSVDGMNPKTSDLCMRTTSGVFDEKRALEKFIEEEAAMTRTDFEYILNNVKFDSIKEWARDKIRELS